MAFGSFSDSSSTQPMAEINTTPLVDVMLVLLVIFIITAPIFHQAVPVDLPRVTSAPMEPAPRAINVAIDADGQVSIDGAVRHGDSLADVFRALIPATGAFPEVHLRADRKTPYERVTLVMAAAQQAGLIHIAFVTDPRLDRSHP